jgi:hypothetical protein
MLKGITVRTARGDYVVDIYEPWEVAVLAVVQRLVSEYGEPRKGDPDASQTRTISSSDQREHPGDAGRGASPKPSRRSSNARGAWRSEDGAQEKRRRHDERRSRHEPAESNGFRP